MGFFECRRLPSCEGYDSRALMILGNRIGLFGGPESYPNEDHANGTENHAKHGGSTHDIGPIGGLSLRYKIALFTLILSVFVTLFCNAIRLGWLGKGEAVLPYLLLGVSGIFATVILGLPLVIGVSG